MPHDGMQVCIRVLAIACGAAALQLRRAGPSAPLGLGPVGRAPSARRASAGMTSPPDQTATSYGEALVRAATLDQTRVPYVEALVRARKRVAGPFFLPGHKLGAGLPAAAAEVLSVAAPFDLPELGELDNLFAPVGPLLEAQELAAQAFGARRTWFLANGSSAGMIASIMACVRLSASARGHNAPKVLLPRNAHRSAVHGLIHSGAEPVWLAPETDELTGLTLGVDARTLREALRAHAGSVACVLLVSPSYEGAVSDVSAAAALCRQAGVPLVVDEAHGAHFGLAPGLPLSALACGATLVVQSTHKTLGALSQAAMLHAARQSSPPGPATPPDDGAAARFEASLDAAVSGAIETVFVVVFVVAVVASCDSADRDVNWRLSIPEAVLV